ncbi:alpha/beta hydrolase [Intrasporangium sp. YIM S08009]|uniref:alpha/beta hydrolase n=1 Tax=Intrasporangium zincisolvens TaxID=3080018 RepID=UPI002B056C0D|nr:alpha/beta hydrolase [Intrasporangium sp. YIM S08009]
MPVTALAVLGTMFWLATGPQPVHRPSGVKASGPVVSTSAPDGPGPAAGSDVSLGVGTHPTSTPIIFTGPVDPEPSELSAYYGKPVAWTPCDDDETFDCGSVRVPVDYRKPTGATATIALRRLPASEPARRIGSLFINPGGPGGSGLDFATEAPDYFGEAVRQRYDVVGFDPRGMGRSDPVDCLSDADLDVMYGADPTPDTEAERRAWQRGPAERNARCLARGGALAANMGTEAVARDLDVLRSAVGDERLNYYGISYGTMIGAVYADFFTSRVGYMVLDSAVLPDALADPAPTQDQVDDAARSWAFDFEDMVDAFVTDCGASVTCPLGADKGVVTDRLVRFLDGLDASPLDTDSPSLPHLTEGWAVTALGFGLRHRDSWPDLVDALDSAMADGDGTDLAWLAMQYVERDEDGSYASATFSRSHLLVTCADWPVSPWDSVVPSRSVLANHPLWARVEPPGPAQCAGWNGQKRQTLLVGADVATPVLVIGNDIDRTTPIEDTEALASEIVRSRYVRVDAEGHGAYGSGNACAARVVDEYLTEAKAPEDDYYCTKS